MKEIMNGIYFAGAIDWDRQLFDELIPTPDGTSYNSYLIRGSEKTALIDTVDPDKGEVLLKNLAGIEKLDYIVTNHAEQDHSGTTMKLLEMFPEAVVVTNKRCKEMNMTHLRIPEDRFIVVDDQDTLSLGDRTLRFILAPWVHWPETMFTYLEEEGILFTCDFLGSHLATNKLYVDGEETYLPAKRYYAEIMMPFRHLIPKYLDMIEELDPGIIAPGHGPLYKDNKFILDAYREWTSPEVKNEVVIAFVSMHGSTRIMVDHLIDQLTKLDVRVKVFNLPRADLGELAMSIVDAATIIIATPAVLAGAHPAAVYAAYLVNALKPKTRYATVIGSYGWGARTVDQIKGMLTNLKVEFMEPVMVKGIPGDEGLELLAELARTIARNHSDLE